MRVLKEIILIVLVHIGHIGPHVSIQKVVRNKIKTKIKEFNKVIREVYFDM